MANTAEGQMVFYYAPWSRASGVLWLLEELEAPYELRFVNVHQPETVPDAYRRIQPHKKVPALEDGSTIVTERAAICLYLIEKHNATALAPVVGDPTRAAFLTMLVYHDAVFDPCVNAEARGLKQASADYSFGSFADLIQHMERLLSERPFAAGDSFTAVDTQLASSLGFVMNVLKVVPRLPAFEAYLRRATDRPAFHKSEAIEAALVKQHFPPGTSDGGVVHNESA